MKKTIKYLFITYLLSDELKSAKQRIVDFIRRKRNPSNPNKQEQR